MGIDHRARFANNELSAMSAYIGTNVGVACRVNPYLYSGRHEAMYTFGNLDFGGDIEVFNDGSAGLRKDVKLKPDKMAVVWPASWASAKPTDALTSRAPRPLPRSTSPPLGWRMLLISSKRASADDIAPTIAWGLDYQVSDRWSIQSSGAYYFNTSAEYGPLLGFDVSDGIKDDWEIGLGTL